MTDAALPDLPSGWRWASLGELALEVRNGISQRPDSDGGVPIFRISAVRPMDLRTDDVRYLSGTFGDWSKYALQAGDLLFTRYNGTRSLVGVCAEVPSGMERRVYPDKLIRVRIDGAHAISGFVEKAVHVGTSRKAVEQSLKTSAGQVGISGAQLKTVPIPIAPLDQQRRIVEKIEALTAKSRRAKEALDAIPPLLERFRQSVLAAAFRGDLTKDWREQHPDVEPADQLLARIRRQRRHRWEQAELEKLRAKGKEPKDDKWKAKYKEREPVDTEGLPELPRGWCWAAAEELAWEITVGHVGPMQKEYRESGVPFLRSQNVRENRYDPTGLCFVSQEFHKKLSKSRLTPGDLVIVRSGAPGTACVVPPELSDANCSDLVIVRLLPGTNPHLMAFYVNSADAKAHIRGAQVGVAQQHFNVGSMKKTPIPLIPLAEQEALQRRLSDGLAGCASIEAAVDAGRFRAGSIDAAVLAKAFRGELVVATND